jgi:hypothetical protein
MVLEPVSALHSLGAAFEHELAACPLRVNALVTGVTYLLGDAIAQLIERGKESPKAHRINAKRLARSFASGLLFLGPLTHFYYQWMSTQDLQMSARVLLDNTLFLSADNLTLLLSITLLGRFGEAGAGGVRDAADLGEMLADGLDELWAMQLTGWRFLPFVAILNYALIPPQHRVCFVDLADVAYAALLSMQLAQSQDQAPTAPAEAPSLADAECEGDERLGLEQGVLS